MINPAKVPVLVVDDDRFMRQLVVRLLSELGFKSSVEAEDGMDAIKQMKATQPEVQLVVLDLEMPKVDGFHFLDHVRNNPSVGYPNIPIIVLTGHANLENIRKAAEFGIHGFLVKPVSKANLEKQIQHALSSRPIDPEHFS